MSDLAERLREYATAEYKPAYQPPICHEAADEIDRLRAQLAKLVEAALAMSEHLDRGDHGAQPAWLRLRAVLDEIEKQP